MSNPDLEAYAAQAARPPALAAMATNWSLLTIGALRSLYTRISPDMPSDLESTSVDPSPLPDGADALHFNYDEGHAGRLTVPGSRGASLALAHMLAQPDPHAYVEASLRIYPRMHGTADELLYFSPGLNTRHQPYEGTQTTSPQRVQHYVDVLCGPSMAQVHLGTSLDQGDVVIDTTTAPILRGSLWLLQPVLRMAGYEIEFGDGTMTFPARSIDAMQTALSLINAIDTPLKRSYRAMFDLTKGDDARAFVLVAYSRSSVEVLAALKQHYDESRKGGESNEQIRTRLRQYVTILTCGNAARGYSDGPAYIHLAARNDTLNRLLGVNEGSQFGAGADAVFVNFDSPFNDGTADNHNLAALAMPYLSLVMAASMATGIRDLWERARRGEMVEPPNPTDTLAAMVRVSKGLDWLWDPETTLNDLPEGTIPDDDTADATLAEAMGPDFVAAVKENCA